MTTSSALIMWTTDQLADSQVAYGLTSGYGSLSTLDPSFVTSHSVNISGLAANTTYHFQVRSNSSLGAFSNSSDYTFTTLSAADLISPNVSFISPGNGAVVSGLVTLSANASDNVGVVGVQFKLDGVNLGAEDTSSPYSISWDSTSVANGTHTISTTARDGAGNNASSNVTVTVNNLLGVTGCGAGTNNSACGPNDGTVFPDNNWTALPDCSAGPVTLTDGQKYQANANISATDAHHVCYFVGKNQSIDLRGHTITGIWYRNGAFAGDEIFNGNIQCDYDNNGLTNGVYVYACLQSEYGGCGPQLGYNVTKLHHLTIKDTVNSTNSSGGPRTVRYTTNNAQECKDTQGNLSNILEFYHNEVWSGMNNATARTYAVDIEGVGPWYVHDNRIHVQTTAAGQGFGFVSAPYLTVQNNQVILDQAEVSTQIDNARGMIFDGVRSMSGPSSQVVGSGHSSITGNSINASNNRCFRIRSSIDVKITNNECIGVTTANGRSGSFLHFGDPDYFDTDVAGMIIANNTIELSAGATGWKTAAVFDSLGMQITNNTWECAAGGCAGAFIGIVEQRGGGGTEVHTNVYDHDENIQGIPGDGSGNLYQVQRQSASTYTITTVSRSSNVSTLVLSGICDNVSDCSGSHNVGPGLQRTMTVTGLSDGSFNAVNVTITTRSTDGSHTVSYANVGPDVSSTAMSGTVSQTESIIFKACNGSTPLSVTLTGAGSTPTINTTCP